MGLIVTTAVSPKQQRVARRVENQGDRHVARRVENRGDRHGGRRGVIAFAQRNRGARAPIANRRANQPARVERRDRRRAPVSTAEGSPSLLSKVRKLAEESQSAAANISALISSPLKPAQA